MLSYLPKRRSNCRNFSKTRACLPIVKVGDRQIPHPRAPFQNPGRGTYWHHRTRYSGQGRLAQIYKGIYCSSVLPVDFDHLTLCREGSSRCLLPRCLHVCCLAVWARFILFPNLANPISEVKTQQVNLRVRPRSGEIISQSNQLSVKNTHVISMTISNVF